MNNYSKVNRSNGQPFGHRKDFIDIGTKSTDSFLHHIVNLVCISLKNGSRLVFHFTCV